MSTELTVPYSFYGANAAAFYCRDPEVILSGPADTGKTLTIVSKLHVLGLSYRNASMVICRKQLTDVYGTVLQTYLKEVAREAIEKGVVSVRGGEKAEWFDYVPTGARIWVAGLDKAGKVLSAQHDIIATNQTEEFSLADWETLTSRTTGRAGNIPYNQVIGDCNPGPPSHWIIARARTGALRKFDSEHRDNPELYDPETGELTEAGERRIGALDRLTGSRKQRLRFGLWAPPEGAIYETLEAEYGKHKVKAFDPPLNWPRVVGVDPVGAYVAAVWLAWDPQARVFNAYREYCEPFGIPTRQHAENVRKLTRGESVFVWVVGAPSERQARQDWIDAGVPAVEPPYADVWAGIDKVNELLAEFGLVVHDSCPGLLSDLGDYRRKLGKDGLPTDSIEHKEQYHAADALRYAIAYMTHAGGTVRVSYEPVQIGRY